MGRKRVFVGPELGWGIGKILALEVHHKKAEYKVPLSYVETWIIADALRDTWAKLK